MGTTVLSSSPSPIATPGWSVSNQTFAVNKCVNVIVVSHDLKFFIRTLHIGSALRAGARRRHSDLMHTREHYLSRQTRGSVLGGIQVPYVALFVFFLSFLFLF
jgi:hypothetical protein